VLNTQLDTTIALHRYGILADDREYAPLVASARKATDAVLGLRSAELLYRALFWAIDLTLLPTPVAKNLPLPMRGVKRLAWKYLIPLLPRIRTAWPRLTMPSGYIERALSVGTLSDAYLSVNVMDLARYRRQFGEHDIQALIAGAVKFVNDKGLLERWSEDASKAYAIGFWAEAMYHLCTIDQLPDYRSMLAEAMLALDAHGIGFPPSLLGANTEAVPRPFQRPCPSIQGGILRVANLCRDGQTELIVVNPTGESITLDWGTTMTKILCWSDGAATLPIATRPDHVPARGWLWGRDGG
jgi:hypothetical protein